MKKVIKGAYNFFLYRLRVVVIKDQLCQYQLVPRPVSHWIVWFVSTPFYFVMFGIAGVCDMRPTGQPETLWGTYFRKDDPLPKWKVYKKL